MSFKNNRPKGDTHRQIWKQHHGPIPLDEYGYRHQIHHIDGDPSNNDIDNLVCLTIHEHYEIHFWQGDWGACSLISNRLNMTPEEKSLLMSGEKNPSYDDTIYSFKNKKTGEIVHMTRHAFVQKCGGISQNLSAMMAGRHHSYEGWTLADSTYVASNEAVDYDVIHTFKNKITGEIVRATRIELVKRCGFNSSDSSRIRDMIRGHKGRKSTKGWTLIRE